MKCKPLLNGLKNWVTDPFGRKQLLEKHEEVLGRMKETTAIVSTISQERFPISKMVGYRAKPQTHRRSAHNDR